jgi:hypothetical protein
MVGTLLSKVTGVTVSTVELAGDYSNFNLNIEVLPNSIDFDLRDWKTLPEDKDPNYLVVGWSGGTTHLEDLQLLRPIIPRILKKYDYVKFGIYTSQQLMQVIVDMWELDPERVLFVPPRPFEEYPTGLANFDIGLAPTINCRFNASKCLDWRTRVSTPTGIKPIISLLPGDKVWNGSEFVEVIATDPQSRKKGVKVVTRCGYTLTMTEEHRQLTENGTKLAKELKVGDKLPISSYQFSHSKCSVIFPLEDSTSPSIINEDWAEVLGIICGSSIESIAPLTVKILSNKSATERLVALLNSLGICDQDNLTKSDDRVVVNNPKLLDFLSYLGLVLPEGEQEYRVPEIIFRSPREVVAAFIKGYVIASFVYAHTEDGDQDTLDMRSLDSSILSSVQELLLGFGIVSIKLEEPDNGGLLRIVGSYINKFHTNIQTLEYEVEDPIVYDQITSIEEVELTPYNIQVAGEKFVAGGIATLNSNLKVLEYGAWGIPCVASKIPPYVTTIRNGKNGFNDITYENIAYLIENESERKRMGATMKAIVEKDFDMRKNVHLWPKVWNQLIETAKSNRPIYRKYPVLWGNVGRNDPCPCGSGLKYKKCECYPAW